MGKDSGARLAMEYALKYSIPRAVIYDSNSDMNNPMYNLNRQLIQEEREIHNNKQDQFDFVDNKNNIRQEKAPTYLI